MPPLGNGINRTPKVLKSKMEIIEKFKKAGQSQVFDFFEDLNDAQKKSLLDDCAQIDLNEFEGLCKMLNGAQPKSAIDYNKLQAAPFIANPENGGNMALWEDAAKTGASAILRGELACFVVAGGQGTRLGYNGPKGTYKATPIMHKSLFQVFAEKILRASQKYGVKIPWLIMTSHINDAATRAHFEENNFFGLDKNDVIFFKQGRMPAATPDGKIIMEDKGKIALSPDGHGGSLRAIVKSGALDELKKRGVKYLSYFQVDNPIVNIVDEAFLGFHIKGASDMSSKMIPKAYPLEKVGHFCMYEGRLNVVEYSDLPESMQQLRNADGSLKFVAGSVAIHVISLDFVEKCGKNSTLPFHIAHKKIPYIDKNGQKIKPESPNGYKFEMFVFDALPMANNPVIIEGVRREEFSPIKNAEGKDSPLTSKKDQEKQFAYWLKQVGVNVAVDADGVPLHDLEISPLFACNFADFKSQWAKLKPSVDFSKPQYLQ